MLTEWKRVLKDGGKLILELPCMNKVLRHIYDCVRNGEPFTMAKTWLAWHGDPQYRDESMCHRWSYTREMLETLLLQVGFRDVKYEKPRYHFPGRDMRMVCYK